MRFNFGTSPGEFLHPFLRFQTVVNEARYRCRHQIDHMLMGGCTTEWTLDVEISAFENSSG